MELAIGNIYKSPTHGRYIQIIDMDISDDSEYVSLDVWWVDKDTYETEHGSLRIAKSDVKTWTRVEI